MTPINILKRGFRLEYLTSGVFQGQGFLVRRAVPLKYGPDDQYATDVDVLGIKFTNPFQPHRIICDCKERIRSKPFERIFWVKGLASSVDALEAYITLPKVSWDIIDFARSVKVRILTKEILEDTFIKTNGEGGKPCGLANQDFYEPFYQRLTPISKKDKVASEILFRTRTLYLVNDPYVSLNIAMSHLSNCAEALRKIDKSIDVYDLWRFIAADLIVVISLLFLYIASDTIGFTKTERQRHIMNRLTYGDISESKAKEIFSLAKELAMEAAKISSPKVSIQSLLPFDIGKIDPPSFAANVVGLIDRAFASPSLYHGLPQLIDFLLFEQALQNKGFSDEEYRRTFPNAKQSERLKVARNIFVFVRDSAGIDLNVFWPHEEQNLPKMNT